MRPFNLVARHRFIDIQITVHPNRAETQYIVWNRRLSLVSKLIQAHVRRFSLKFCYIDPLFLNKKSSSPTFEPET